MLKAALAKIAHGLLVGTGFGLALGAVMYGYAMWQMKLGRALRYLSRCSGKTGRS